MLSLKLKLFYFLILSPSSNGIKIYKDVSINLIASPTVEI